MPFTYFFANDEHLNEKDSILFDLTTIQALSLVPEEKSDLPQKYIEELKQSAINKKYLIFFEVDEAYVTQQNKLYFLNTEALINDNVSLQPYKIFDLSQSTISTAHTDENIQEISLMFKKAIEAIKDYLIFYKKINIEAAKKEFCKKFPQVAAKVSNADNVALNSTADIADSVRSEINIDQGTTRAIAYLMLLEAEQLAKNFKLLCLSALLDTTNSKILRRFVATASANNTHFDADTDNAKLDIESIILSQKNIVDLAIDQLSKKANTSFAESMDLTEELANAIELLHKGNAKELGSIIPVAAPSAANIIGSVSSTRNTETEPSVTDTVKTAIRKYLMYVKQVNPETSLQQFTRNTNPSSFLFFYISRDGVNRALCYLNVLNKVKENEEHMQLVIRALLKTKSSKELRFYVIREILKNNPSYSFLYLKDEYDLKKRLLSIGLSITAQASNIESELTDARTSIDFEKKAESLSNAIEESKYCLDIQQWLANNLIMESGVVLSSS